MHVRVPARRSLDARITRSADAAEDAMNALLARLGAIRVRRRTMYAILIGVIVATVAVWHMADASPTREQVREAVDPAFTQRHVSLAVMALAAAADVITTEQAFHRGCHEGNPVYGSHPSRPLLIGTHGAIVGAAYYGRIPTWANYTIAALFGAVAIHNENVRCTR